MSDSDEHLNDMEGNDDLVGLPLDESGAIDRNIVQDIIGGIVAAKFPPAQEDSSSSSEEEEENDNNENEPEEGEIEEDDDEEESDDDEDEEENENEHEESAGEGEEEDDDAMSESSAKHAKPSRELLSILALAKEANLDTNISHKRKTIEAKSSTPTGKTFKSDDETPARQSPAVVTSAVKKSAVESRAIRYPITADHEADNDEDKSPNQIHKRKRSSLNEGSPDGSIDETHKRSRKRCTSEIVMFKVGKDMFCWRCHRDGVDIACETCPRSFHQKCLKQSVPDTEHLACPECVTILKAESTKTRSETMKGMSLDHLCSLLKFAASRMKQCSGSDPFVNEVNEKEFPDYKKYIIQPMHLALLERNIKDNVYGSTQAFEADAQWIQHNSIIFNSYHSKLTNAAKAIVKICKQEMAEIENCPSCYLNANTKKNTWFVEVCPKPHLLVWAKLKGFPYWPAKAMCTNSVGLVDVRFFGAHDRAWISFKDCFLYSLKDPNSFKQKRPDIEECVNELNIYLDNLRKVYDEVVLAPLKTPYEPSKESAMLKNFLPKYIDPKLEVNDKKIESEDSKHYFGDDDDSKNDVSGGSDNDKSDHEPIPKIVIAKNLVDAAEDNPSRIIIRNVISKTGMNTFAGKIKIINRETAASLIKSKKIVEVESPLKAKRRMLEKSSEKVAKSTESNDSNEVQSKSSKISDTLIKRLSDASENGKEKVKVDEDEEKQNEAKDKNESKVKNLQTVQNLKEITLKLKPTTKVPGDDDKPEESEKELSKSKNSEGFEKIESELKDAIKASASDICKIIHTSITNDKQEEKSAEDNTKKKRRLSTDELDKSLPLKKMVKIVNINSILNKPPIDGEKAAAPASDSSKVPPILIKSEPETDTSDSEYMEAKRKYLSALNISEKQTEATIEKLHEIRTRSKTEEKKEKLKNISKVIEDVAKGARKKAAEEKRKTISGPIVTTSTTSTRDDTGEIQVKSFAKFQATKQRARKSFPTANFVKNGSQNGTTITNVQKKDSPAKATPSDIKPSTPNTAVRTIASNTLPPPLEPLRASGLVILAQPQTQDGVVLIPSNPALTYSSISNPIFTMVPPLISTSSATNSSLLKQSLKKPIQLNFTPNQSQNYIPQNEEIGKGLVANDVVETELGEGGGVVNISPLIRTVDETDEFGVLNSLLPESLSKAVSDLLCRPPPKLKPRPPGPLSQVFDGGVSSAAGTVTTRINSIGHKLGDYFRGMLIETLEDLGKTNNPEATVTALKMEVETLKHKHETEMTEMRKNVTTILKDIQKSIVEERDRVIDETKSICEVEAIKRVDEAKSKQWCINCFKEAQFYCCWNTSYCDYPCQQKHWPKHMQKCTQHLNQSANATLRAPGQPLVLRPANPPSKTVGRILKPAKVYMNRQGTLPPKGTTFSAAAFKTSGGNHLTLVESTPGNYELLGNGPIAVTNKFVTNTTMMGKLKAAPVSVTSPSATNTKQKMTIVTSSSKSTAPAVSSKQTVTTISDDSD